MFFIWKFVIVRWIIIFIVLFFVLDGVFELIFIVLRKKIYVLEKLKEIVRYRGRVRGMFGRW